MLLYLLEPVLLNMIKSIACLICVAFVMASCNMFSDHMAGVWMYAHSNSSADTVLTPANFLYLQKDGSYTSDLGVFDHGKWSRKNSDLVLTSDDHHTITMPIRGASLSVLTLDRGKNLVAHFEGQPFPFKDGLDDPFSMESNQWRIPAKHKETEAEIRSRLYNHCRFWETYFNWGLDNDIETLDVRNIPTPIKIYGNGFGLKKFDELPATWRSYFYDSSDCRVADQMIKDVFRRHDIDWPKTENRFKIFSAAFKQLQQYLKP
jgi:hypothetical protein